MNQFICAMPGKSKTARYYAANPGARKRKQAYDAKFNKKPSQVKKRVALNKYNRKHKDPKGNQMDASHKGSKIVGYSHQSRNRGDRNNTAGDKRARGRMGRRRR